MERLALLRGDGQHDDQVLETDVMRFVAIIGIVFWIIFALVQSIPFQAKEIESKLNPPTIKTAAPAIAHETVVLPPKINKTLPDPVRKAEKSVPHQPIKNTAENTDKLKTPKPAPPKWRGIQMQFHTLDDLLALMVDNKVRLFGRAKATGFDLFFEGISHGNAVRFKGTHNLPPNLWEIKSGNHYTYFLDLMAKTYPAIRSFPTRQVLISFVDKELETRVNQTVDRLKQENKNGILSITRTGEVMFQGFDKEF